MNFDKLIYSLIRGKRRLFILLSPPLSEYFNFSFTFKMKYKAVSQRILFLLFKI